jgi:hypothetical protein
MSKYTTEVRYICERLYGLDESTGYASVDAILAQTAPKIFDFDFPIFDEDYRLTLEIKILKHYYTREIGAETVGLWKLFLNRKMNEIMPYYNTLYELMKEKRLYMFNDVDISTKSDSKQNGTSDSNGETTTKTQDTTKSTNTATSKDTSESQSTDYSLYSDTPQGGLNGVNSESYLTTATKDTSSNNSTSNGSSSGNSTSSSDGTVNGTTKDKTVSMNTTDYLESKIGKSGGMTYYKQFKEALNEIVDIDMQIINELNDLFFGLW